MLLTLRNLLFNALKPKFFLVMASKVMKRLEKQESKDGLEWARENTRNMETFFSPIDNDLWREAISEYSSARIAAKPILSKIKYDLGGGGAFPILYFLCRFLQPKVVVETGVAAGWSSLAFLTALDKNKRGTLYSSDFPYFRLYCPEQFIGVLVPSYFKKRWVLDTRGDRVVIPHILKQVSTVDLFHYDSDKSCSGKEYALKLVNKKVSQKFVLIFDDIQDDTFFKDLTRKDNKHYYLVFEFEGKYLGLYSNFNLCK